MQFLRLFLSYVKRREVSYFTTKGKYKEVMVNEKK